jgi:protein gp37
MSENSAIEWTDATWNPVTGCTKISPGCKNCYAERLALRLKKMGNTRYKNAFSVTLHPDQLELPLRWTKRKMIFVNSMSDLFHEAVPDDYIKRIFAVMVKANWHIFQVLTKRSVRLEKLAPQLPWAPHIWQGVSIENQAYTKRVHNLRKVPASVRFLSIEPLLGPISSLPLEDIHWVIVGGESGPRHRAIKSEWVREIQNQCVAAGVAFFFKQWGGMTAKAGGRVLDGQTWDQMPSDTPDKSLILDSIRNGPQRVRKVG